MFLALWEYEVKPRCEERFEKVHGAKGDWARGFRSDSHYHQTQLGQDAFRRGVYLTMDFWQSLGAYEEFMARSERKYKESELERGSETR